MMEARRRALGRGLGALIPTGEGSAIEHAEATHEVPIESIDPNPYQPREAFPEDKIDELATSVRERGILQPLLVRRSGERYQLLAGERRLRAARKAGMERVPVLLKQADDREALEIALVENIQRENLGPIEEARALWRLCHEFQLTQEEVAAKIGKDRSTVANAIRLLQLPKAIQDQLAAGALSAGHARGLLALTSADAQVEVGKEVASRRLSVRETERLVRARKQREDDLERRAVEDRLSRVLGTRVRITAKKAGEGRLEIEYYSTEQLNDLVARLGFQNEATVAF